LSLAELWLERALARQRQREEADRDLVLAWRIQQIRVMTNNKKRLPDLLQLLSRGGPQSAAQQVQVLAGLGLRGRARLNVLVKEES
jgi:hypothetical protein